MPRLTEARVLDQRTLNRAVLARQLLLRREPLPVIDAIERLIGLQAQLPNPPYVGLWTRLTDFRHEALTSLIERRRVVRSTMMRATQHLVTARDYVHLRPVLQPMIVRSWRGHHAKHLAGIEHAELATAARALVAGEARSLAELRAALGPRWPKHDPAVLANAAQFLLPLVHVPPGGTWGRGGAVPAMLAESWLRRPLSADVAPEELIVRYLSGFGPASTKDIQQWSGLTGLRAAVEGLRPQLRVFRSDSGTELFDVPGAPLPDADTPAPVRFLPEYDNLTLAYADRTRVISDANRKRISAPNGMLPTVLVDGMVAARWKVERARGRATLVVEPFSRVASRLRAELTAEGLRLLDFTDAGAAQHDVRIAAVC